MSILNSLLGIVVILLIAYLCSNNRRRISLRVVSIALLMQFSFAFCMLYLPAGKQLMIWMADKVTALLDYTQVGTQFLLGGLATDKMFDLLGADGFIFVFKVLPVLVFLSSLSALLFHLGVMQKLIMLIGGGLHRLLGTSRAESMSSAANIFLGVTEAPLVIRPYLKYLSSSEFFAILVGGIASIAGTVLLGYAQYGVKIEYLLAASFMSAPAGLLFAKLFYPETEQNSDKHTTATSMKGEESEYRNSIDAVTQGASIGVNMALNIAGMLLALLAIVAMLDGIIMWATSFTGYDISLTQLMGWLFSPVAWLLGVDWAEAQFAGQLLGQKVLFNEFIAYANLQPYLNGGILPVTGEALSVKTQVILSFALCGFANIGTIGIAIGGIGAMCPERRGELTSLAFKAFSAAILVNLMNGAIAGLILG
ncbi:NupC/NupG family nucleoside CNT transporter [Providencia burhodogranariea]|uniref:NupC family protein n=1 Tax=Providencia burhodogranariea DSM 19968 TaxID=1141662 RepID=K8X052_9GAMM|nr:nucleoside transporter C-terminal domain-containing protein [Providencia burhodogranariea]EKT63007.1 NupC family protein [Providencia burhodogranariea DSM 19968]